MRDPASPLVRISPSEQGPAHLYYACVYLETTLNYMNTLAKSLYRNVSVLLTNLGYVSFNVHRDNTMH